MVEQLLICTDYEIIEVSSSIIVLQIDGLCPVIFLHAFGLEDS